MINHTERAKYTKDFTEFLRVPVAENGIGLANLNLAWCARDFGISHPITEAVRTVIDEHTSQFLEGVSYGE